LADRDATLDSLTASSTSWPAKSDWQEDLLELLCYLLMPPHTQPEADEQPSDTHLRTKLLSQCVQRLDMFYGIPRQTLPLAISSPIMNLFLTSTVWSGLIGLGKRNAFEHGFLFGHNLEQRPEPRSGEFGIHPYQAISKRADSLTSAMMRLYRAAFVLSFGGAALAVLSSVALLAWVAITAWEQGHPPLGALLAIGGGEILIIALLLRLEHIAHLERWQEHGVDFRFLAELVRPMPGWPSWGRPHHSFLCQRFIARLIPAKAGKHGSCAPMLAQFLPSTLLRHLQLTT